MLSENTDNEVQFIKRQFLCCVPVKDISWNNFFSNATWSRQAVLVANTVELDVVKEYPIKINYQVAFLKYVISRLEKLTDSDVNDDVYDAFGRLMSLVDCERYYKHYNFDFDGRNRNIILEENPNIISEGTTGLCSWQAALGLSEWCLQNRSLLTNKTILELGSGVGLTGLVVALNCEPKQYNFTDCHTKVLETLRDNISLNVNRSDNADNICELNVINLSWEDVQTRSEDFKDVEIVLAADVVYDSSLFPCLRDALSCFLSNERCSEVYFCCTERNPRTLTDFLEGLGKSGLNYEELSLPEQDHLCWSTEVPIRLFRVRGNAAVTIKSAIKR
ncbi:methyltransferase [Popillia japonica]|uniref:Methyltransferase n=1 Tax=Popillia japonica TaxID=7064 RepID=A0AAW1LG93_POPJA